MKKLFVFVALAALVPSFVSCTKAKDIKVMSYNIRLGIADDGENSWENRKPASAAMVSDQAPAVFGVQEAYGFQIDYIKENCPQYDCVGVGRDDGADQGEHMSVFFDKNLIELQDWGTYWLSETPDSVSYGWDAACRRTATWTLLKVKETGKQFFFVNTHLDHKGKEARKNGLALIVERITATNPDGFPMVLTGDFNVLPTDPCLVDLDKIMKSARTYAEDSDQTPSYNGWQGPKSDGDYIYYSGFEKCTDFKVVTQSYVGIPFVSDHYPVVATLVF